MTTSGTAGHLRFSFPDLVQEIQVLRGMARPFIAAPSSRVLPDLLEQLEGIWQGEAGRELCWELGDIWTLASEGEYEAGARKGGMSVVACISGTWDVRPIGRNAKKPKEKQKRLLEFCGIASTRVRLFNAADLAQPIAMWRMELGDANSPGCYFHVQVMGDQDEAPFPKSVPIPRLPSLAITPMGAIEYVLGELFQDRWAKVAMENTGNIQRWASIQKRRLLCLLNWQRTTVEKSLTSPWVALKIAKPEAGMFLP